VVTKAILGGGLVAGVLDIADALVFNGLLGASPMRVLQAIASGLLGAGAFQWGWASAVLGLALHFFIATSAAACYVLASRTWPVLVRRPFLCGAAFGLAVFVVMNFLVLPLSAFRVRPMSTLVFGNLVFAHVFFVGLPIALMARRGLRSA
jgi:hypothetical protein